MFDEAMETIVTKSGGRGRALASYDFLEFAADSVSPFGSGLWVLFALLYTSTFGRTIPRSHFGGKRSLGRDLGGHAARGQRPHYNVPTRTNPLPAQVDITESGCA